MSIFSRTHHRPGLEILLLKRFCRRYILCCMLSSLIYISSEVSNHSKHCRHDGELISTFLKKQPHTTCITHGSRKIPFAQALWLYDVCWLRTTERQLDRSISCDRSTFTSASSYVMGQCMLTIILNFYRFLFYTIFLNRKNWPHCLAVFRGAERRLIFRGTDPL